MDKLDNALDRYRDFFGENYPLVISDTRSQDEIISEINSLIKNKTKAQEPILEKEFDY